jgi:hypothetical protein
MLVREERDTEPRPPGSLSESEEEEEEHERRGGPRSKCRCVCVVEVVKCVCVVGRKKIKIEKISDSKNRQVTFNKRKVGLLKKAIELSVLCDCEVSVLIFHSDKLYEYSSKPLGQTLKRYLDYEGSYEVLDNSDVSCSLGFEVEEADVFVYSCITCVLEKQAQFELEGNIDLIVLRICVLRLLPFLQKIANDQF